MAIPQKPQPAPADLIAPADLPLDEKDSGSVPLAVARHSWWHQIGGGSLTISIIIHAIVIVLAILIYFQIATPVKEEIKFLPGGGGGGSGADAKIAQKKRSATASAPKTRIIGVSTNASVTLPDITTSMSDFSSLTKATPMGGGMGGGKGGLRGSGEGGLYGNGRGTGVGPGIGQGFIPLFGMKMDARRLAVVLDVSNSMHSFLPIVIKEVDKIAPGTPIILHFGCGLSDAEISDPEVELTTDKSFDNDRMYTSLLNSKSMDQQDRDNLATMFKKRPKTYFVPTTGIGTTWIALLDNKLKDCDAIYWFADFADPLGPERLAEIAKKLKSRRQKLYIHPSNPKWLVAGDRLANNVGKVESELVTPSGGKVIKADVKTDNNVKGVKSKAKPAG